MNKMIYTLEMLATVGLNKTLDRAAEVWEFSKLDVFHGNEREFRGFNIKGKEGHNS